MPTRSADQYPDAPSDPAAEELDTRPRKHDQSLAELYYRGFLDDLAASPDPDRLARFIEEVFTADPRLLSDEQKMSLGGSLADWARTQPAEVKTAVWRTLGFCEWARPMLGIVLAMPNQDRESLLEIDPVVHAEVIAPWLGDRPGRKLTFGQGRENANLPG